MGISTKVKILLAARNMTGNILSVNIGTSGQNVTAKLRRGKLSQSDLHDIAKACNASFEGVFTLNHTG